MLELKITQNDKPVTLRFEHSLLSLAKWESRHKKIFLSTEAKTTTEMVEYFEEMLISPPVRELVYLLSPEQLDELTNYVNETRTVSVVPDIEEHVNPFNRETVTSDLIYYWMVALQIPFDAEKWHLSRLLMLVRITNFKSQPPEKQDKMKVAQNWREINERRKAKYNTKG